MPDDLAAKISFCAPAPPMVSRKRIGSPSFAPHPRRAVRLDIPDQLMIDIMSGIDRLSAGIG